MYNGSPVLWPQVSVVSSRPSVASVVSPSVDKAMSSSPVVTQSQSVRSPVVVNGVESPANDGPPLSGLNSTPTSTPTTNGSVVDHKADLNGDPLGQKSPMCRINEICRYNDVKHEYHLIDESGPAHQKTFTGGTDH